MPIPKIYQTQRSISDSEYSDFTPDVTASPDGRYAISWLSSKNNYEDKSIPFWNIESRIFNAISGFPSKSISSPVTYNKGIADAVFLEDGNIAVVLEAQPNIDQWNYLGNPQIILLILESSTDESLIISNNTMISEEQNLSLSPQIVSLSNGHLAISWGGGNNSVLVRIVDSNGDVISQTIDANPSRPILPGPGSHRGPSGMIALADGGFVLTFEAAYLDSHEDPQLPDQMTIFANDGSIIASEISIPGSYEGCPSIAQLTDGRIVVVGNNSNYGNGYSISFYSQTGNKIGGERIYALPYDANPNDYNIRIAALNDGRFIVVSSGIYESDFGLMSKLNDVWATVFLSDGSVDGSSFRVNDNTVGNQSAPSIATLADGRVVITWSDSSVGASDIFEKVYDPREVGLNCAATTLNDQWQGTNFGDSVRMGEGNDQFLGGTGSDTILGDYGDDYLYGNDGTDMLNGGDGNDVLRGGAGIDSLTGGTGNDLFYFAAGDLVSAAVDTVNGGGISDTDLVRIDGVQYFNVSVSASGGNARISVNYSTGSSAFIDIASPGTSPIVVATSSGVVDPLTLSSASRSNLQITWFDWASTQEYTQYTDIYNSDGARDRQFGTYDGIGGRWDFLWDSANTNATWIHRFDYFNNANQLASQQGRYDAGGSWITNYDPAATQYYSYYITYYNADGHATQSQSFYDSGPLSGGRGITTWDTINASAYSEYTTYYDASGNADTQNGVYDGSNGTWWVDFDQNNTEAWQSLTVLYNLTGVIIQQWYTMDNGTIVDL